MTGDRADIEDDPLIVEVGPVAHGGHCVARVEGRVIFVRHALPGERVRVTVTERKKSYWRADAVEILRSAPERVTPPCRFAGSCGGCDFQHVSAAGQRELKTAVLREQLTRLGGLAAETVRGYHVEPLSSQLLGWRSRVRYAVDSDGGAGFRKHRSHEIVHIDKCVIASEAIQDCDALGQRWPKATELGVAEDDRGELSVFTTRRGHNRRMARGDGEVVQNAAGWRFQLEADAFWQVHHLAANSFAATTVEMSGVREGDTVWDLYAGAGLFSVALAPRVGRSGTVVAVETDQRGRARKNLADFNQARVRYEDVSRALPRLPKPDIVVLDPPRSGAGGETVAGIAAAAPRAIVYVACDPAALARDVATFASHGFELAELRAFDAFPMTHHFETIACLKPVTATT